MQISRPPLADAPATDQVGLAAASMAFGALLGVCLMAATVWGVRTLQVGAATAQSPDLFAGPGALLLAGTAVSLLAAAGSAWTLMAPITSYFRRGGLTLVTLFATPVLSLVTMPIDHFLGRTGLLVLAGMCALGCWLLSRRSFRTGIGQAS